jgi:7-carboxy-7-deazaguanine synthase
MKVSEIFFSPQGEGRRSGQFSVFIRLADCNLTCGFCDTDFASGKELSLDELHRYIVHHWPQAQWLCWTGGEPTLSLTQAVVDRFNELGYLQSIETNGSNPVPRGLAWTVVSPKVAEHVLKKNFPDGVDELRYVRHAGQLSVPTPAIKAKEYYISPLFDGDKPNAENLKHCLKLCEQNPQWKISVQLHKLLRVL